MFQPTHPTSMILWHRLHKITAETYAPNQSHAHSSAAECQKLQLTRPCAAMTVCLSPNHRNKGCWQLTLAQREHYHQRQHATSKTLPPQLPGQRVCHENSWYNHIQNPTTAFVTPSDHCHVSKPSRPQMASSICATSILLYPGGTLVMHARATAGEDPADLSCSASPVYLYTSTCSRSKSRRVGVKGYRGV